MATQGIPWGVHRSSFDRRELTPFTWLSSLDDPTTPLTAEARRGITRLRRVAEAHVPVLVRGLVHLTSRPRNNSERLGATVSVLNRRRRAATEWVRAILDGATDLATLHSVGEQWLPTLAGAGHDRHRGATQARACIEYVRGALTALVLARPEDNLVPEARCIYALEAVLSRHLTAAWQAAARREPARQPRASLDAKLPV